MFVVKASKESICAVVPMMNDLSSGLSFIVAVSPVAQGFVISI